MGVETAPAEGMIAPSAKTNPLRWVTAGSPTNYNMLLFRTLNRYESSAFLQTLDTSAQFTGFTLAMRKRLDQHVLHSLCRACIGLQDPPPLQNLNTLL